MNAQTWDEIVCTATNLIARLDNCGHIFDSSTDDIAYNRIVRCIDANKMDIMSMLYNIVNLNSCERQMEWTQFLILLITLGGLFLWNRAESNADRRAMQATIDAIEKEMKDFHGRLCAIEERRNNKS